LLSSDLINPYICFAWFVGNLHFANVLAEDAKGGVSYVCIVQNTELRSLVQGDDQKIDPRPISGNFDSLYGYCNPEIGFHLIGCFLLLLQILVAVWLSRH